MPRSLRGRRRIVAVLVFGVAVGACGGTEVELRVDGPCSNPDIEVDGRLWETDDTIPDTWRGRLSVTGSFRIAPGGEEAVFESPDGGVLEYRRVIDEFRAHDCRL